MQEYTTIRARATGEIVEKRSRFIGEIFPVQSEEEALRFLAQVKAQHREARHHVYAFLLKDGMTRRYSDDGEPQGTGGIPILQMLEREGVTDVLAVVTRYFGGVLLGTGGLTRAYTAAAQEALAHAQRVCMCRCAQYRLSCAYSLYGRLQNLLSEEGVRILSTEFGVGVLLEVLLPEKQGEHFCARIVDETAGEVRPQLCQTFFADF